MLKKKIKRGLATIGARLPGPLKGSLLRLHPFFRFLMLNDSEIEIDFYLGDLRYIANPQYASDMEVLSGTYEPGLQSFIRRWVSKDSVCVDVGANTGAITLSLAKQVGKEGRIFAFEPGAPYRERLAKNLRANPSLENRVEILSYGLSEVPGELFWLADAVETGNAGLLQDSGTRVSVTT